MGASDLLYSDSDGGCGQVNVFARSVVQLDVVEGMVLNLSASAKNFGKPERLD